MFSALFLFALLGWYAVSAMQGVETYEKEFLEWMHKHSISFLSLGEFKYRLQVFAKNHELIQSHNGKNLPYKLGHNEFSHMTLSEFRDHFRIGSTRPGFLRKAPRDIYQASNDDISSLPAEVDWVAKGAVTDVKNQGQCGSCWTFSAVGALEGAFYLKHGTLVDFSEQELVSCDDSDSGCNGGLMDSAFAWIQKHNGLCTDKDFPYTSGTGSTGTCPDTPCKVVPGSAPKSYKDVKAESVSSLMSAVSKQPVSIAIEADQFAFQFYHSGVLSGSCGQNLDHGVLLVGYGTDDDSGLNYWKVKNSWGSGWGMNGYILIERGTDDLCGVLAEPSFPIL